MGGIGIWELALIGMALLALVGIPLIVVIIALAAASSKRDDRSH